MATKSVVPALLRKPSTPDEEHPVVIHQWTGQPSFPACRSGDDFYLAVRPLCKYFGVSSQIQLRKLQYHKYLGRYMRMFYLHTRGGVQPVWCLHLRVLSIWIVLLDPDEVKDEMQYHVVEWTDVVAEECNRLFMLGEKMAVMELPVTERPVFLPIIEPGDDMAALRADFASERQYNQALFKMLAARITALEKQRIPPNMFIEIDSVGPDDVEE